MYIQILRRMSKSSRLVGSSRYRSLPILLFLTGLSRFMRLLTIKAGPNASLGSPPLPKYHVHAQPPIPRVAPTTVTRIQNLEAGVPQPRRYGQGFRVQLQWPQLPFQLCYVRHVRTVILEMHTTAKVVFLKKEKWSQRGLHNSLPFLFVFKSKICYSRPNKKKKINLSVKSKSFHCKEKYYTRVTVKKCTCWSKLDNLSKELLKQARA